MVVGENKPRPRRGTERDRVVYVYLRCGNTSRRRFGEWYRSHSHTTIAAEYESQEHSNDSQDVNIIMDTDIKAYFVAVHGGAGFHELSEAADTRVKQALRLACKYSLERLSADCCAIDAVDKAISTLEDDPCLNAGYGSNLTLDGTVECDASIMDGRSEDFGAVGAVSGVKNPIKAAHAVLQHSRVQDALGRIPPLSLAGGGAALFAHHKNLECVPPESLICPRTKQEWEMWKSQLELAEKLSRDHATTEDKDKFRRIQDTVGAVAWDTNGGMAAGVSSGGLLLKVPGRIGEAAVYGAGCWASERKVDDVQGVACSVSGSGEYIVRMMLAKTVADAVLSSPEDDVHDSLQRILNEFHDTCRSRGETSPSAGILLLVKEVNDDRVTPRLWCAFTTHSMAVGYASSLHPKPKAMILRRPTPRDDNRARSIYITTLPLTG
ncbi:hypothetical protein NM688_g2390 [Phlebia brevispora]|uniref:Uncharacterized protein n=1 Tax=Phlebia brevispora TaxID=194682 RepID=A0ACC1T8S9_9APHY|nr:hypothetical protein NM688_g2390 [Phlebia brevispora]